MRCFLVVFCVGLLITAILALCGWIIANVKLVCDCVSKKPCDHPNLTEMKWLYEGTPMVTHNCPDCEFYDSGHADPETWLDEE